MRASKSADSQDDGPLGAGYSTEIPQRHRWPTSTPSRTSSAHVYGIETGPLGRSLPFTNDRYFARADLQITDDHRLEGTFQRIEECAHRVGRFLHRQLAAGHRPQHLPDRRAPCRTTIRAASIRSGPTTSRPSCAIRAPTSPIARIRSAAAKRSRPIRSRASSSASTIGGLNGTVLAGPGNSRSANDLRTTIQQYKAAVQHRTSAITASSSAPSSTRPTSSTCSSRTPPARWSSATSPICRPACCRRAPATTRPAPCPNNVVGGLTEGAFGNFTASGDINDAAAEFSAASTRSTRRTTGGSPTV